MDHVSQFLSKYRHMHVGAYKVITRTTNGHAHAQYFADLKDALRAVIFAKFCKVPFVGLVKNI